MRWVVQHMHAAFYQHIMLHCITCIAGPAWGQSLLDEAQKSQKVTRKGIYWSAQSLYIVTLHDIISFQASVLGINS
jgi:hypothetical protein